MSHHSVVITPFGWTHKVWFCNSQEILSFKWNSLLYASESLSTRLFFLTPPSLELPCLLGPLNLGHLSPGSTSLGPCQTLGQSTLCFCHLSLCPFSHNWRQLLMPGPLRKCACHILLQISVTNFISFHLETWGAKGQNPLLCLLETFLLPQLKPVGGIHPLSWMMMELTPTRKTLEADLVLTWVKQDPIF